MQLSKSQENTKVSQKPLWFLFQITGNNESFLKAVMISFLKNVLQQELGEILNKDTEEYDQVLKLSNYSFEVKAT